MGEYSQQQILDRLDAEVAGAISKKKADADREARARQVVFDELKASDKEDEDEIKRAGKALTKRVKGIFDAKEKEAKAVGKESVTIQPPFRASQIAQPGRPGQAADVPVAEIAKGGGGELGKQSLHQRVLDLVQGGGAPESRTVSSTTEQIVRDAYGHYKIPVHSRSTTTGPGMDKAQQARALTNLMQEKRLRGVVTKAEQSTKEARWKEALRYGFTAEEADVYANADSISGLPGPMRDKVVKGIAAEEEAEKKKLKAAVQIAEAKGAEAEALKGILGLRTDAEVAELKRQLRLAEHPEESIEERRLRHQMEAENRRQLQSLVPIMLAVAGEVRRGEVGSTNDIRLSRLFGSTKPALGTPEELEANRKTIGEAAKRLGEQDVSAQDPLDVYTNLALPMAESNLVPVKATKADTGFSWSVATGRLPAPTIGSGLVPAASGDVLRDMFVVEGSIPAEGGTEEERRQSWEDARARLRAQGMIAEPVEVEGSPGKYALKPFPTGGTAQVSRAMINALDALKTLQNEPGFNLSGVTAGMVQRNLGRLQEAGTSQNKSKELQAVYGVLENMFKELTAEQ